MSGRAQRIPNHPSTVRTNVTSGNIPTPRTQTRANEQGVVRRFPRRLLRRSTPGRRTRAALRAASGATGVAVRWRPSTGPCCGSVGRVGRSSSGTGHGHRCPRTEVVA